MAVERRVRVVVADDDRDTVMSLAFILGDEGYDVRRAYNGDEALTAVREFEPDAVVLDIAMPEPNGWEVARRIRQMELGARPLLIAISGQFVKPSDRVITDMAGFDHFCPKPCEPAKLLGWLANLKSV
jgi:CheY-like chemotaxis protein